MISSDLFSLAAASPLDHVTDKKLIGWGEGDTSWLISNATVMLVISALVTYKVMRIAAERIQTGSTKTLEDYNTQGPLANLIESVCLYLRNDVFKDVLHDQTDRYVPFLWSLFWFILINNLIGLIPILDITAFGLVLLNTLFGTEFNMHNGHQVGIGGTATQSIFITGGLALVSACFYMGSAIKEDWKGFLKHLTMDTHFIMWPIMIPIEIFGYIIKPVVLAIRLFANMTAGHTLLAVLFSFVPALIKGLGVAGWGLSGVVILAATAMNLMEIMVSFIQAYIFTFLTCLFLGQLVVHEDHDHDEEHGHDGAHAH